MKRDIYPVQILKRQKSNGGGVVPSGGNIHDALVYLNLYTADLGDGKSTNFMYLRVSKIIGIKKIYSVSPDKIHFSPVYRLTIYEPTMKKLINGETIETDILSYNSNLWGIDSGGSTVGNAEFDPTFSGEVDVYDFHDEGRWSIFFRDGNTFANYDLTKAPEKGIASTTLFDIVYWDLNRIIRNDITFAEMLSRSRVGSVYDDKFLFNYDDDNGTITATDYLKSIYTSGELLIEWVEGEWNF